MKTKFNRLIFVIVGIFTVFSGLLIFLIWQLDSKLLINLEMGAEPMTPTSSLTFILLGLALILQQRDDYQVSIMLSRLITILIALFCLIALSQYVFGLNYGINEMLIPHAKNAAAIVEPINMAPNTAFTFILLAIVLFARTFKKLDNSPVILILYIIALIISIICLIGYATGMIELTGLAGYSKMSMNTAILFIAICIGIYSKSFKRTYDYIRSSQNPE